MSEIILKKRYPHSREEDITDAFMRGYVKGKADRPQGEWIDTGKENIYGGKCIKCSVCEHEVIVTHIEDEWYCRHCGADMRGADDDM